MSASFLFSMIFQLLAPLAALGYSLVLALLIHEAGHALAGWSVGLMPGRVVIGLKGRYLGSLRMGRVPLVFCGWPNGGLNQFGPDANLTGRKGLWVLLGGPLAGLLALAAAWVLDRQVGAEDFFLIKPDSLHFWLAFLMMGNLCCALRSLLPVPLGIYGRVALFSDGWRITGVLAERKSLSPEETVRLRKRWAWGVALFCTALVGIIFTVDYGERFRQRQRDLDELGLPRHPELQYPTLSTAILLLPPIFLMTYCWKVAKSPMPREIPTPAGADPHFVEAFQAFLRLDFSRARELISNRGNSPAPEISWWLLELEVAQHSGDFASLEALSKSLLEKELDDEKASEVLGCRAMGCRVIALSGLGREEEADDVLDTLLVNLEGEARQLPLDTIATQALRDGSRSLCRLCLPYLRRLCKQFPDVITLQGTLGAVLVELELEDEAEPILRRVLKTSESLDDIGIVSVFLAELEAARGRVSEARRHADRAVRVCDAPWVHERAARIPGGPVVKSSAGYGDWRSHVSGGAGG